MTADPRPADAPPVLTDAEREEQRLAFQAYGQRFDDSESGSPILQMLRNSEIAAWVAGWNACLPALRAARRERDEISRIMDQQATTMSVGSQALSAAKSLLAVAERQRDAANDHHADTMNELVQILEAQDDDIAIDAIVADAARERMAQRDAAIRELDEAQLAGPVVELQKVKRDRDALRQRVGALETALLAAKHHEAGCSSDGCDCWFDQHNAAIDKALAQSREHARAAAGV